MKDLGGKFVLVLVALFLIGGMIGVTHAGLELNAGVKQVSVMEAPAEHFVMFGISGSYEMPGFTLYGSAAADFSDENIDQLEADGERLEAGVILFIGAKSAVKISVVKDNPFTGLDTETIAVKGGYKF